MKVVACRLPDLQHEGLRQLAFERNTSIAELIRQAVDAAYREDLEDVRDMEQELARYQADPRVGIDYRRYREERASRVSG